MQAMETLEWTARGKHVAVLSLNRPRAANALNTQMGKDLLAVFSALGLDPGALRCLILTGEGAGAFCAGGDLKERDGMSDPDWQRQHVVFEQAFYAVMDCPIPVIAAVNGAAYGGGAELALACDFVHATASARFALTETRLGIIPGGGGTQTLARAIGARRAKELIFAAAPFSAAEAQEWGMVNTIWPDRESLMSGVLDLAHKIAGNAPLSVRRAKRAIGLGIETDLKTGLGLEVEAYNQLVPTADRIEGVRAFNEKRDPDFSGR
ncbi:MAG: enoyl-CoA hydratase/isomerase family protein [Rhodobacteraceae bacterium]|nr:enoyl-CoA hydratase/isomerase family protein [Paracoccaceae bacterium]